MADIEAAVPPLPLPPAPVIGAQPVQDVLPRQFFEDQVLLNHIGKFLSYKDFMQCRRVTTMLNSGILRHPKFLKVSKGKLSETWYRAIAGMNLNNTFQWTHVKLTHFTFHRHSSTFKNYWHNAVSNTLSTLILSRCSFECDGFIFLMEHCPLLEKLAIHECKLRDLDDFHTVPGRTRAGALCAHHPQIEGRRPITHLTIDRVFKFEQCFMDYLIARTDGTLTSLTISKCFTYYDPRLVQGDRPSMETLYQEFQTNVFQLLRRNRASLTTFNFQDNHYQMYFFQKLLEEPTLITAPNLNIGLTVAEETMGYAPFVAYMSRAHPHVEKLTLQFRGFVANATFNAIVQSFIPTLKHFTLLFAGNVMNMVEKFDITILSDFVKLDSLVVRDTKSICPRDIRVVLGGRRRLARPVHQLMRPQVAKRVNDAVIRLDSNVDPGFLGKLPGNLTKCSIEQCMVGELNFVFGIPTISQGVGETASLVCALTNVQIRGPWIHSLHGIVGTLVASFPGLETLALTYCDLDDSELTYLGAISVLDIRRCMTYGLALIYQGRRNPTADEVVQAVEQAVVGQLPADRPRLFMLKNLKHLDLSGNPGISDVSMYESIRNPGLKSLELMSCNRVTDTGLEFLKVFCPNLEELNVKNCRRLSKHGLNQLIFGCRKLRKIFTTQLIMEREVVAFLYTISPNYGDIVIAAKAPQTDGFILNEEFERPIPVV